MPSTTVPVGVTSVAGYSVTLVSAVMAVVAYLSGDRSQETVGTIVAGAVAALAFVSTQLGRYAQAHAQVKAKPQVKAEVLRPDPQPTPTFSAQEVKAAVFPGEPDGQGDSDALPDHDAITGPVPPDEGDPGQSYPRKKGKA